MVYLEISTLQQPRNSKRKGMQSIKMQLMQLICNKKSNMSDGGMRWCLSLCQWS